MLQELLVIASIASTSFASKKAVATFDESINGISGTVTVDNGVVMIDLDLSAEPDLPLGFLNCSDGGFGYHIHTHWTHGDTKTEGIGSECGPDFTKGHYDPWAACGKASGLPYCDMCIDADGANYDCDFDADPYSCEVGDWSSKYGNAMVDDDYFINVETDGNFYEVIPDDVSGMSVVFHCFTGERAFCASFADGDDTEDSVPDQATMDVDVAAYFNVLSDSSMIVLMADGGVEINLEIDTEEFNSEDFSCTNFEYTIWINEDGADYGDEASIFGTTGCEEKVTLQWDPTNQCQSSYSSSTFCTAGNLCDDTDYEYLCDFDSERYSCAPGDLSGKFGLFDSGASFFESGDSSESLIPPTAGILGATIAIHCPITSTSSPEFLACAKIVEYVPDIDTMSTTEDIASQISFGIAIIVSFVAILF